jgi:hypothetical protein
MSLPNDENFLEKWTKDCLDIKSIFQKAKKENRMISIESLKDYDVNKIKIIDVKKDYAIIKFSKGSPEFIYPFYGNGNQTIYDVYSPNTDF